MHYNNSKGIVWLWNWLNNFTIIPMNITICARWYHIEADEVAQENEDTNQEHTEALSKGTFCTTNKCRFKKNILLKGEFCPVVLGLCPHFPLLLHLLLIKWSIDEQFVLIYYKIVNCFCENCYDQFSWGLSLVGISDHMIIPNEEPMGT